jgi:hypothetical protein
MMAHYFRQVVTIINANEPILEIEIKVFLTSCCRPTLELTELNSNVTELPTLLSELKCRIK